MIALLLSVVGLGLLLDSNFCPIAPTPKQHTDNIGMRVDKRGEMTTPLSAEVAARLVDTRMASRDNTIGWLYLDERGTDYVVLKPFVRRDVYDAFGMRGFNLHRPETYTEAKIQAPLVLPSPIEVRSCYQSD